MKKDQQGKGGKKVCGRRFDNDEGMIINNI
jgi:hypothetical protein